LRFSVVEETGRVVRQRPKARFVDVARGLFQAGRDDFSVGGKVDELGL
jgi:hypothetical protein